MRHPEHQYLDLLRRLRYGADVAERGDRTGTGTRGIFGAQMRFDLSQGFPLLTTKKVFWRGVVEELLWMLRGETNILPLLKQGVSIWTDWPLKTFNKHEELFGRSTIDTKTFEAGLLDGTIDAKWGELGPVYGAQWRRWQTNPEFNITHDQLMEAQRLIRTEPNSRRIVVSAWNVGELDDMALSPCHCLFQFFVANGRLSCHLYQRSADILLGVPFNIASYSLLTMMMAEVCGLEPGDFVHTFGDLHLYLNHMDQAAEQLEREPRPFPEVLFHPPLEEGMDFFVGKNVWDFKRGDIELAGYDPHSAIKAPVAV